MSESEMRVTVEVTDTQPGPAIGRAGPERRVSVEISLPTGEGSEGPSLEGLAWEEPVIRLVERMSSAASTALGGGNGYVPAPMILPTSKQAEYASGAMYDWAREYVERYEENREGDDA